VNGFVAAFADWGWLWFILGILVGLGVLGVGAILDEF